jgi:hypothetical protein
MAGQTTSSSGCWDGGKPINRGMDVVSNHIGEAAARSLTLVADGNRNANDQPLPGATPLKPGTATLPFWR